MISENYSAMEQKLEAKLAQWKSVENLAQSAAKLEKEEMALLRWEAADNEAFYDIQIKRMEDEYRQKSQSYDRLTKLRHEMIQAHDLYEEMRTLSNKEYKIMSETRSQLDAMVERYTFQVSDMEELNDKIKSCDRDRQEINL